MATGNEAPDEGTADADAVALLMRSWGGHLPPRS
jgi:hypothetical protein